MRQHTIIHFAFSDHCLRNTFFMTPPDEDGISSYGWNLLDDDSIAWDEIYECVADGYWFNKIADELCVDVNIVRKALLNKACMRRLCHRLTFINIKERLRMLKENTRKRLIMLKKL